MTQATTSFILTEKIKARDKYKDIYIHERNKALMKGASDKKRAPKVKTRKYSGNSPSIFQALTQIAKEAEEKEETYHQRMAEEVYIQQMMKREEEFEKRSSAGSFDYGNYHRNDLMSKELEHVIAKRRSVSPQITEDMKEDDSSSDDMRPSEVVSRKKQKKRGSNSISHQISLKKHNSSGPRPMKAKASLDTHISTAAESNLTLSNRQKFSKGSSMVFDENVAYNETQLRSPLNRSGRQFSPQYKNTTNLNEKIFVRNPDSFSPRDPRFSFGSQLSKWKFAKRGSEGSAETYLIYDQRGAIPVYVESPLLSVKSPKRDSIIERTPRRLSAIMPRNPNLNRNLNMKKESSRKASNSSMRSQSKPTGGRRTPLIYPNEASALMYSGIQVMSPGRGIPYEERPKRLKYAYIQSNRIDSKNLKAEVTDL